MERISWVIGNAFPVDAAALIAPAEKGAGGKVTDGPTGTTPPVAGLSRRVGLRPPIPGCSPSAAEGIPSVLGAASLASAGGGTEGSGTVAGCNLTVGGGVDPGALATVLAVGETVGTLTGVGEILGGGIVGCGGGKPPGCVDSFIWGGRCEIRVFSSSRFFSVSSGIAASVSLGFCDFTAGTNTCQTEKMQVASDY